MKNRIYYLAIALFFKLSLFGTDEFLNSPYPYSIGDKSISDMPPEVLEHIINLVPVQKRNRLASVSRSFRDAVGLDTIKFSLKSSQRFSPGGIGAFLATLELREQIKRKLEDLKGRIHKVKHIVIKGEVLLAIPSELRDFSELEEITFDGIDSMSNEPNIKTEFNSTIDKYMQYFNNRDPESGLYSKTRHVISTFIKKTHEVKSEVDLAKFMNKYNNEVKSLKDDIEKNIPIPFFSVQTAREKFPKLTCIRWQNIFINHDEKRTYTLETPENFKLFEERLGNTNGDVFISFILNALNIQPSEIIRDPNSISRQELDALLRKQYSKNQAQVNDSKVPVLEKDSFSKRFLNNLLLIIRLS